MELPQLEAVTNNQRLSYTLVDGFFFDFKQLGFDSETRALGSESWDPLSHFSESACAADNMIGGLQTQIHRIIM